MAEPVVDVIIPVHSSTRPVARAVSSVLEHTIAPVRVIVVAHNTDLAGIRAALNGYDAHPAVDLHSCTDGISSPAGPRNVGIEISRSQYLSFLDSDDTFSPGAIDSWLALAAAAPGGAEVVLSRIAAADTERGDPFPPTRLGRQHSLHPVKDRLAYRSAPFGLISRKRMGTLRFSPGLRSGEDLEFATRLWFSGARISYDRTGPAYLVGSDAADRVTAARRSVAEDFSFLDSFNRSDWFTALSGRERRAIGVKIFRLHFFDAVLARLNSAEGLDPHRAPLARIVAEIDRAAPGAKSFLSRRDRAAIDAAIHPEYTSDQVLALLEARWLGGADSVFTRNPLLALHAQGPRRTMRSMLP